MIPQTQHLLSVWVIAAQSCVDLVRGEHAFVGSYDRDVVAVAKPLDIERIVDSVGENIWIGVKGRVRKYPVFVSR